MREGVRGARRALLAVALAFGFLGPLPVEGFAQDAAPTCPAGRDIRGGIDDTVRTAIAAKASETPDGQGRLFRIERDGVEPSYLFGTMHLSDPRVLTLPGSAQTAFAASRSLVIESTDILDEAQMAVTLFSRPDLTSLPAGERLSTLVPAERLEALSETLSTRGAPLGTVETLQPWFVAVMLAMPDCEMARQARGEAVLDLALAERAQAAGKPVGGLESGLEQLEALASLPRDLQVENLLAAVDLAPRLPDIFETMIALYLEGSIASITPTIEHLAPAGTNAQASAAIFAAYEARLIDRRNLVMAERLGPRLEAGGVFAAVGALHLPGERGLVALLRADGWTVTRAD